MMNVSKLGETLRRLSRAVLIASTLLLTSCTYVKHASIQADYERLQETDPSQRNLKHMIERQSFTVIGQTLDVDALYGDDESTKAVAAFSNRFKENELVDVMHDVGVGTHFGLDLPSGDYPMNNPRPVTLGARASITVCDHDPTNARRVLERCVAEIRRLEQDSLTANPQ